MMMRRLFLRNPLIRTELCGSSMRVGGIHKRYFGSTKTLDDIVVTSKCAQVGQKTILSVLKSIYSHTVYTQTANQRFERRVREGRQKIEDIGGERRVFGISVHVYNGGRVSSFGLE